MAIEGALSGRAMLIGGIALLASLAPSLGPAQPIAQIEPDQLRETAVPGIVDVAVDYRPPPSVARGPVTAGDPERSITATLAALRRGNGIAGLAGDLYDNRDRGHSRLNLRHWPQLGVTSYDEALRARNLDYGLNQRLRFDRVVFGNSSTAISTPAIARSHPRFAQTVAGVPARLAALYVSNQIYVYPSHRDHRAPDGDLFPANTPYMLVSQGSSGSDRPHLDGIATALAALRPATKEVLRDSGLIAPTVQMIVRKSLVDGEDAYMTGQAHPSAIEGSAIDLDRIARLANAIAPDEVPPLALLSVVSEPSLTHGLDMFGDGLSETLFDTPWAVARVARGMRHSRRYVLDASRSFDVNGRPLTFHWRLLRGDPDRIDIRPLDGGRRAEITIDWHERRPIAGPDSLMSHRVDIGLFADNGAHQSAPAFFSLAFPMGQQRTYDEDGRLLEVDYSAPSRGGIKDDPLVVPARYWTKDTFDYGADGTMLGWRRLRGNREEAYTRHGYRVLDRDDAGRPRRAEAMEHVVIREDNGVMRVEPRSTGDVFVYGYENDRDQLGWIEARE
jgi:hypothetical protein